MIDKLYGSTDKINMPEFGKKGIKFIVGKGIDKVKDDALNAIDNKKK